MVVTAKEGSIFLKLHEEEGIELHSEQALACQAEKNLSFSSRQNLTIQAEKSIFFTCDSSSLVMDGITDIQGSQVKMRGSVKAPVSVANEEEGIDEFQLGLDVTGMIPISGGGYDG